MTNYGERIDAAFIDQLKSELDERGITQNDFAAEIGVDDATMDAYMSGEHSMPMPIYMKVAEALNLSPRALMQRAEARLQ